MNGKKKKNRILVLDSGKDSHYLRKDLSLKSFYYEQNFYFLKFNNYKKYFLEKKLIRNESQIEDSFQI